MKCFHCVNCNNTKCERHSEKNHDSISTKFNVAVTPAALLLFCECIYVSICNPISFFS